ncbi:hypothetical protein [Streptomyces xantholiticus]|uniref:hypothetical protein n=1 Tax=Streptomyces xantholiticus TaxID=68285 RepID=UPI0019903904|nr:hypothetical protein [Streptomyces xantholiticus]GGW69788.1 hypothetical protein GCM10010381_63200 [Streptomyces xantholiticus]
MRKRSTLVNRTSLLGSLVVAAGATLLAAPAAQAATTPVYHMNCVTGISGNQGWGTCTGSGRWVVRAECAWSPLYSVSSGGWTDGTVTKWTSSCAFGVESVRIVEY